MLALAYFPLLPTEPLHKKLYLLTCVPNTLSNQLAHAHSMISHRCSQEEILHPCKSKKSPKRDSDHTARMCSLI